MTDQIVITDMNYCIVTDAAADLDNAYLNAHPNVYVMPMNIVVNGKTYRYGPDGNLTVDQFYEMLNQGFYASTSQINIDAYMRYFRELLAAGNNILYLCFSSGMSGMYQNAVFAAGELMQEYPDRRVICVDTLCAAPGEGFLVREAVRKKDSGVGLAELAQWAEINKQYVSHWFTVDSLEYLHRGGRVSMASAVLGTALQIKPLLCVDYDGTLKIAEKLRGTKRAMSTLADKMAEYWKPDQSHSVAVVHACCPDQAEQLQHLLEERFPEASIYQSCIGPVIGSHTGPGLLALVFWGNGRTALSNTVSQFNCKENVQRA